MANFNDLPIERRLDTRLKVSDFGATHRIDGFFDTKNFSDGFTLSDTSKEKLKIISEELQERFFGHEGVQHTDIAYEPFYFACAVTSIIECRPRILSLESNVTQSAQESTLNNLDSYIDIYLRKCPRVDALIVTYADKLGAPHISGEAEAHRMTYPRLFSGLTFFLLECENAREYEEEKALARGLATFQQILSD